MNAPVKMDDPTLHPMWQAQVELEKDMADQGVARYRASVARAKAAGRETDTKPVKQLHLQMVEKVAAGIDDYCFRQMTQRKGKPEIAYARALRWIDSDVAAWLALRVCLRMVSVEVRSYNTIAREIGTSIETEMVLVAYAEQFPAHYKADVRRLKEAKSTSQHAETVAVYKANTKAKPLLSWASFSDVELLHIGSRCLDIILGTTGLFETYLVAKAGPRKASGKSQAIRQVHPKRELMEWIAAGNTHTEMLEPAYGPCVVPPKPWAAFVGGGYYTPAVRPLTLIAKGPKAGWRNDDYRQFDWSNAYRAVNYVQAVGWRLNRQVLAVFKEVWPEVRERLRPALAGLPVPLSLDADSLPELPANYDSLPPEQQRDARRVRRSYYQQVASRLHAVLTVDRIAGQCDAYAHFEAFYYPHRYDFRGRIYPIPAGLQPQGGDLSRGLLEFAEGKPIGSQEGADWLYIHTANCFGVDKVSFEERIQWVEENEEVLLAIAQDPLSDLRWAEADDPWQALAACFDLLGYAREGFDWVSHLPVRLDGTCNGIQHFSALARDEIGGRAVNLLPGDKPEDIYRLVADKVTADLERLTMEGREEDRVWAAEWLAAVDHAVPRGLTKKPVMTMPYGATHLTKMRAVEEWLVAESKLPAATIERLRGPRSITFMATRVTAAINSTVIAPARVMEWLQFMARQAKHPIVYLTPDGFPMRQAYYEEGQAKRIRMTNFAGENLWLIAGRRSSNIDRKAMASAISANFVHSLDAATLRMTCHLLSQEGISTFTTIHDSYGTHACDVPRMNVALRSAFIGLYTGADLLADAAAAFEAAGGDDFQMRRPPPPGSLRLEGLAGAAYFFA